MSINCSVCSQFPCICIKKDTELLTPTVIMPKLLDIQDSSMKRAEERFKISRELEDQWIHGRGRTWIKF